MAGRRGNSGLSIGQLFTLTFGFLLASIAIFVFGLWVGRDLAARRQSGDGQVMRIAVDPTPTPVDEGAPPVLDEADEAAALATATHTLALPTVALPQNSPTPRPTPPARATATPRHEALTPARGAGDGKARWTIQVTATNDQVQALVQARRLRSQGFDAYTVQTEIGGSTWYRVQAGKYNERAKAQADAQKLRGKGFEAAFVSELR
jgi:cell division protein FtsN